MIKELMDNLNTIATLVSAFGLYIFLRRAAKKDVKKLETEIISMKEEIKSQGNRLTRVEVETNNLKSMMQTIVAFLLGHKTGS